MLDRVVGNVTTEKREHVPVFAPDLEVARKRVRANWDRLAEAASPRSDVIPAKLRFRGTLERYHITTHNFLQSLSARLAHVLTHA